MSEVEMCEYCTMGLTEARYHVKFQPSDDLESEVDLCTFHTTREMKKGHVAEAIHLEWWNHSEAPMKNAHITVGQLKHMLEGFADDVKVVVAKVGDTSHSTFCYVDEIEAMAIQKDDGTKLDSVEDILAAEFDNNVDTVVAIL